MVVEDKLGDYSTSHLQRYSMLFPLIPGDRVPWLSSVAAVANRPRVIVIGQLPWPAGRRRRLVIVAQCGILGEIA